MNKQTLLNDLIAAHQEIWQQLESLEQFPASQLLHKSDKKKWNAVECFQHIMLTEEIYLKQYRVIKSALKKCDTQIFQPGWLGNYFANTMRPNNGKIKSRMATAKFMDPTRNMQYALEDPKSVITQMKNQRLEIIDFLNYCMDKDIKLPKVQTAIPLLKLNLGDSLRFITAHTQRHMLQAQRAAEAIILSK